MTKEHMISIKVCMQIIQKGDKFKIKIYLLYVFTIEVESNGLKKFWFMKMFVIILLKYFREE